MRSLKFSYVYLLNTMCGKNLEWKKIGEWANPRMVDHEKLENGG